jgi:hypothetical protein
MEAKKIIKALIDPHRELQYTMEQLGNYHSDANIHGDGYYSLPFAIKKEGDCYFLIPFNECPDYVKKTLLQQI